MVLTRPVPESIKDELLYITYLFMCFMIFILNSTMQTLEPSIPNEQVEEMLRQLQCKNN